ncbi:MAG TPA: hypothetical protein PLD37_07015, partial [Usitatibacteraceae bacterium]|nr:hypothetical protein [Usitatibacteraceae bacterium]
MALREHLGAEQDVHLAVAHAPQHVGERALPRGAVAIDPLDARLRQAVQEQIADGDTAVYDATLSAAKQVAGKASDDRISAVVVLTDGQDNAST